MTGDSVFIDFLPRFSGLVDYGETIVNMVIHLVPLFYLVVLSVFYFDQRQPQGHTVFIFLRLYRLGQCGGGHVVGPEEGQHGGLGGGSITL